MIRIIYPRKIPMMETEIFRKHISPDFPDLYSEIAPTCPLVMVNSNELYEQATPTLHKVVNIGGIGMQFKDAKPLDQEFQSLVDKSKGVFIMSFGSVANATMMPSHWKTSLMEAFSRFPEYQFVMRYTSNDMDEFKPKNVKLTKWIPQADLLKHPKTLGFITHGGQNSIQETILAGKPMLAIPLFGDQFRNSRVAEQMGMGLVIGKAGMNADFIAESIRKLIEDKSYLQTAKRLSNMAAKKPIKPEELLNKWTTFLAEFKTLENLVPEGVNLNFIQYHSLDVIGFLLTVAFLVLYLLFCTLRALFRYSAKVAVFYLELSNSQVIFNKRVAESLADHGHDVTLVPVQAFDLKKNVQFDSKIKVHVVDAKGDLTHEEIEKAQSESIFNDLPFWDKRNFALMEKMSKMMMDSCNKTIHNKEFLEWIKEQDFDVSFTHMYDYCIMGMLHAAKVRSWVWLSSGSLIEYVADAAGVPLIPSYMPPKAMDAAAKMTFYERIKSLIGHIMMKCLYPRMIPSKQTELFRKYLSPDFPDLYTEVARSAPLIMVNNNELYDQAEPTLHKVVNIGGLGMQFKDAKPLDQEFQSLVDKSKGVFIMSFGSVANATMMPSHWKTSLMEAFSRFPEYQFVMRYTANDMDEFKPKNVKLTKWIPQADLLKHRKTIGFITHGGYNSIQETIVAGKPLISIALFGDQPRNARVAEQMGMAVRVDKNTLTADAVASAIKALIEEKSYTEKAERLSEMAAKKPIKPEELLDKWTTFLAEFQTLDNLIPEGQNLNFFQYYSLDVISFLLFVIFFVLYIIFALLRAFVRCICCRKNVKAKKD
ncbi:unnamed protein product, partial [Mesorhabditis belari]|uniref:glucuronosyltransferase n=1 Tax=Mesorhabditis belari TaxID=2138241 RepID=A0AAF3EZ91_9BILA